MAQRLTPAVAALAAGLLAAGLSAPAPGPREIRFVFTSDAHYGITRAAFRGRANVPASVVNGALVSAIDSLDGPVDFLVEGGDVANREEAADRIQPASVSWAQFTHDYVEGLTLRTPSGAPTPVYVVPGNHDVSNAVGFYKPMTPAIDPSALVGIYNLLRAPATRTTATYRYATDRVLTTRDIGGVHFVFLTVWPDSITRAWLERDLARVGGSTPVVVFTHDQPEAQSKHFTNPNGAHDVNAADRFENLLADEYDARTSVQAWEAFVRAHPNIAAYFHGNSNWNEFYDWSGPRHSIALHTFRVDSPMKGKFSGKDETKLSFQLATIDPAAGTLTVRECLWNTRPADATAALAFGASTTVSLSPRIVN